MVKRKNDEPDNKALKRLREFEAKRKPVPDNKKGDDEKKKDKKQEGNDPQDEEDSKQDSATDE
jgi:hypothetical protein